MAPEVKELLLECAFQAPTAGCQQLYTILDIVDQGEKEELAGLCDHQPFIAQAPVVLIFCADCQRWLDVYGEAGTEARKPGPGDLLLAMADAVIAAQNVVVAAFCRRKYESDFSREMSRSAAKWLEPFQNEKL